MIIFINIQYNELALTVKRALSIIGKRAVDDKGTKLFSSITLGSNEEAILHDFFESASVTLTTLLRHFVTSQEHTIGGMVASISLPDNHNSALQVAMNKAFSNYMTAYALYSWLLITAPRIAEKYLREAEDFKAYIIQMTHEKKAPNQADDLTFTVTTTVTPLETQPGS